MKKTSRKRAFFEAVLADAKVNRETGVISRVAILAIESLNGRRYPMPTMQAAIQLFEGCKSFLNHSYETREIQELLGRFNNITVENGKMYGDLTLVDFHEKVFNVAEKTPDIIGFSIDADGIVDIAEDNIEDVIEIKKVYSVDLVTDPATTKGLFESREETKEKKEESGMKLSEATIADLRRDRSDLFELSVQEGKDSRDKEVKDLTEEIATLKSEKETREIADKGSRQKESIDTLLKDSDLKEEHITEAFKNTLYNLQESSKDGQPVTVESQVKVLIEDRVALSGGVKQIFEHRTVKPKEDGVDPKSDVALEEAFAGKDSQGFHAILTKEDSDE